MSLRSAFLASVCAAFLAASAAVSGAAGASTDNPNTLLAKQAYKALGAGDAKGAIEGYSKAIESNELEPEVLANALLNRALAYQTLGEHPKAIEDYTTALRLDAMSGKLRAMALYNRALSYQKVQRPALAIEDYTGALFLDATFAHAYYGRGNLLRDSGQYLFALADYDKALQNKYPDQAKLYYNQALTFEALQRPDNMRQALTLALAANPKFDPARQKLAALDSGAPILQASLAASQQSSGGTLVARKQELPDAHAPSANLLPDQANADIATASVSAPEKPKKKITDRVAAEETATASIEKPAEEKVLAVEAVTEDMATAELPAEEAAVEAASAEPEVQPVQKGWSVQIASAASEDAAWSTFKKMQQKHKVLRDKEPVVVKADLGNKGIFYRVRLVGYEAQDKAKQACSKLKSGGVKCYVSRADG